MDEKQSGALNRFSDKKCRIDVGQAAPSLSTTYKANFSQGKTKAFLEEVTP